MPSLSTRLASYAPHRRSPKNVGDLESHVSYYRAKSSRARSRCRFSRYTNISFLALGTEPTARIFSSRITWSDVQNPSAPTTTVGINTRIKCSRAIQARNDHFMCNFPIYFSANSRFSARNASSSKLSHFIFSIVAIAASPVMGVTSGRHFTAYSQKIFATRTTFARG